MSENSSNSTTAPTLADGDLLKALRELANLRDDAEAFERFCKRWPELGYASEDGPDPHPIDETELPRKFWLLYERKYLLQDLWEGDSLVLMEFLLPSEPPEEIRERYADFVWGPASQISLDWRRGEIVYAPKTPFQRAIYTLFRKSAVARVCANPDCPARFFVGKKVTQRYCSDKCAEVLQKAWKRQWWAEHGDAWRRGRKKTKRKSGGERG